MTYFIKRDSGYRERLRYLGDDWYSWESKNVGESEYFGGYAGHVSTFYPQITEEEKKWAGHDK